MPQRKITVLKFSSLIIGIIAIVSFVTIYSLLDSFNLISHTHDVIYQIHHIKDDITDCQTSVRETIFSNNKSYLVLYIEKSPIIEAELDHIQWLTRDNEVQQSNIYSLRQNVRRRLSAFREYIDLYNAGKIEEAQQKMKTSFGESWVATTRNLSEIIESEEQRLLEIRLHDYKQKANLALYGIPILMILFLIIFNTSLSYIESHFT